MKCLRCQTEMERLKNNQVEADVCTAGCGGIWFDGRELKRMDESHEVDPQFLEKISRYPQNKSFDKAQRLDCPRCQGITLMRHYYSPSRTVELDECAGCAGLWFDAGEYIQILKEFPNEEKRQQAAQVFVNDVFGKGFEGLVKETKAHDEKTQKISKILRFLSPGSHQK